MAFAIYGNDVDEPVIDLNCKTTIGDSESEIPIMVGTTFPPADYSSAWVLVVLPVPARFGLGPHLDLRNSSVGLKQELCAVARSHIKNNGITAAPERLQMIASTFHLFDTLELLCSKQLAGSRIRDGVFANLEYLLYHGWRLAYGSAKVLPTSTSISIGIHSNSGHQLDFYDIQKRLGPKWFRGLAGIQLRFRDGQTVDLAPTQSFAAGNANQ
jgi:hypothetical protein